MEIFKFLHLIFSKIQQNLLKSIEGPILPRIEHQTLIKKIETIYVCILNKNYNLTFSTSVF